ncbi:EAL and HDOD domain-containing protein [Pseudoalteromonas xiamenensis]|uniref:EAL and HDOD domain-containing protein n=1 Tax=Pseudoalteromonas xiamenensis TaxID=882626 RepID=UPI0027E3ED83|nr:EAL domain-containing protein [Pseudoalteromonas xiamenensis]WMN58358.1 EAL domain-containing protein [Pseudoalteromonas xiamenensis]
MLMSGIEAKVKNSTVQFIARQAILDAEQNIFAYELLYRDSHNNAFPVGVSDAQATGRLFFNSLMFIGIDRLAAGQRAFINLSDESLLQELPRLLKPNNLVIEIVERSQNIPSLVETVTKLKKQGYKFALDDYDGDEKWEPLLGLMDYIKLEVQEPLIKTTMALKKLKRQFANVKIVVERIEDMNTYEYLKQAGCDLFQGYYFAHPEMMNHGNIEPSKMVVFELLRCTAKANINFKEVQTMVAKDISLTARILKLANARSGEGRLEMKSISQAVVYLGEDAIRQFVRVLALSELGVDKPTELTKMGLARARFLEVFLFPGGPEMAEQGYLIGLMSILDAILEIELAAIVAEFSLDSSLSSALLSYQGMLGGSLQLALAVERNDWQEAENILLAIRPATPVTSLYEMALESRQYSDDIFSVVSDIA